MREKEGENEGKILLYDDDIKKTVNCDAFRNNFFELLWRHSIDNKFSKSFDRVENVPTYYTLSKKKTEICNVT